MSSRFHRSLSPKAQELTIPLINAIVIREGGRIAALALLKANNNEDAETQAAAIVEQIGAQS